MNLCEKVWYEVDTATYLLQAENGTCIIVTPERLGQARYQKGWKETANEVEAKYKNTGLSELNKREKKMNNNTTSALNYGSYSLAGYPSVHNQFQYIPPNTRQAELKTSSLTSNMTRLTTSGDWTIALNENNKLVAFDSNGQSITAIGSLICANGRAWMWNDGKLWSGVMEHVEAEAEARQREADENRQKDFLARQKVINKYNEKIKDLIEKKNAALGALNP